MIIIISMLIVAVFITERKHGVFLALYSVFLLFFENVRVPVEHYLHIETDGKYFYRYWADVQFIMMMATGYLITGWQQMCMAAVFILFMVYYYLIYLFWGLIPVEYSHIIAMIAVFVQIYIITAPEPLSKSLSIGALIGLATLGQEYFL